MAISLLSSLSTEFLRELRAIFLRFELLLPPLRLDFGVRRALFVEVSFWSGEPRSARSGVSRHSLD